MMYPRITRACSREISRPRVDFSVPFMAVLSLVLGPFQARS